MLPNEIYVLKCMTKLCINPLLLVVGNKLKVMVIANKILKQVGKKESTQENFESTQFSNSSFPKNLDFESTHDSRFKKSLKLYC